MTDQLNSTPSKDLPAPPPWADSKAREQVVNEWSHILGEVRPAEAEPSEEPYRVELLQYEEVELTEDPPSLLRFPPMIWVNGARYPLDQATELAELINRGVALAAESGSTT